MTFERVTGTKDVSRSIEARHLHASEIGLRRGARPAIGFTYWFRLLVLRQRANAMLRRVLRRPERIRPDEMSPYMLRDIGLPPDFRR